MTARLNILLIEDDAEDALLIQDMLSNANISDPEREMTYTLTRKECLEHGIEALSQSTYNVVLLDLSLGDSQGFETFQKTQDLSSGTPIIVLSGLNDVGFAVEAVRKGAQDYLVKGQVDGNLLVRAIHYAIERKRAEERIQASLFEKELLLKEIHHRVKNNMQIISSLLSIQSRRVEEPLAKIVFKECQNRVRSMALIHEKLYGSKDLARIDFAVYVKSLANYLYRTYETDPNNVKLNVSVDQVFLGIDLAIPCGLIINELISNALKYGFPSGWKGQGEIEVTMHHHDDHHITLTVRDNGVGIPGEVDVWKSGSLGMHLVKILV